MDNTTLFQPSHLIVEGLGAPEPDAALAEHLQLFGWLVGDWEFDWSGYQPDGSIQTAKGEWHFAWVLGGRAIQDVWILPSRAEQEAHHLPVMEYGTAVRFYDPRIDAWRINWSGPLWGRAFTFVGRKEGNEIVMETTNEHGWPLRWIFSQMTDHTFHWRAIFSEDQEQTWRLQQEMVVRRVNHPHRI